MFFLLLPVFGGVFLSCFGVVLALNSHGLACVICLGSLEESVSLRLRIKCLPNVFSGILSGGMLPFYPKMK